MPSSIIQQITMVVRVAFKGRPNRYLLHNFAEQKDAAVRGGPSTNNFRKT